MKKILHLDRELHKNAIISNSKPKSSVKIDETKYYRHYLLGRKEYLVAKPGFKLVMGRLRYAVFSPSGGLIAKVQTLVGINGIKMLYPEESRKLIKYVKINKEPL